MNRTLSAIALAILLSPWALAAPAPAGDAQHVAVPLSDPAKPAHLEVALITGDIAVEAWDGKEVLIEARAAKRLDDDEDDEDRDEPPPPGMKRLKSATVGFEVEEKDNRVTVSTSSMRMPIQLLIKVPRRSNLTLSTVSNGNLKVTGVEGAIELKNVNGAITAERIVGSVVAETVNGDVRVKLQRVTPDTPMAFSTLNGDVEISLPADYRGNLSLRSDNGEIYSEFDVAADTSAPKVTSEREGKRFRVVVEKVIKGTLGGGGPELRLQTFNGNLYLKKSG